MKTLGQIACKAFNKGLPIDYEAWGTHPAIELRWEASAAAVRDALIDKQTDGLAAEIRKSERLRVIEECAKVCEKRICVADGRAADIEQGANELCAAAIRSLK